VSTRPLVGNKDPSFVSDGDDRSVLLVQVHRKQRFGKKELVGSFSDTIGGILGRLKDGGTVTLQLACSADAISTVKVLEAIRSSSRWPLNHVQTLIQMNFKP
jgi:hypothetical protein